MIDNLIKGNFSNATLSKTGACCCGCQCFCDCGPFDIQADQYVLMVWWFEGVHDYAYMEPME